MGDKLDYYHVLDVPSSATPGEIKAAYRVAAKKSHPDAGGTAAKMELVNEAYVTLSKEETRRQYDSSRIRPAPSFHHPRQAEYRPTASPKPPAPHRPAHSPRTQPAPASGPVHHPSNLRFARNSAWRIVEYNAQAALLAGLVAPFLSNHTPDHVARTIIALAAFAPVYGLAVGIVFLFAPGLRIALAFMAAARKPRGSDALALFGVAAAAIPLAAFWLVGFGSGLLR